jgi:hypothetical protein
MIEEALISYLSGRTSAGAAVYAEIPRNPSAKYIIVEKTGSMTEDRVTTYTVAIKSYASSMIDAASLNEEVKDLMKLAPYLDDISSCKLNSDYNFTDPTSKQYRYQAVFQITYF